MKNLKITPGPWRVQADPLLAGKHPLHDNRFITTDHDLETWRSPEAEGHGDDCYGFVGDGKIIAVMRDTECQAGDATLIAQAPALLAQRDALLLACQTAHEYIQSLCASKPLPPSFAGTVHLENLLRDAISLTSQAP